MIKKTLAGFCIIFGAVFSTAGATAFGHSSHTALFLQDMQGPSTGVVFEAEPQGHNLWLSPWSRGQEQPAWQSLRPKSTALPTHQEAGPLYRTLAEDLAAARGELSSLLTVGLVTMTSGKKEQPEATRMIPVPEPTTMLLFGAGLIGLAGLARRRHAPS